MVFLWLFVVNLVVCILQLCYVQTVRKKETFSHDKLYMFQPQLPSLEHDFVSIAGISADLASFC